MSRHPTVGALSSALPWAALALSLVVPGHPLSLAGGLPWGPLALFCAVLLGIGVVAAWPLTAWRWSTGVGLAVLGLAIAKLLLAITAPRYGLEASYYANDRFRGPPEKSMVASSDTYTRVDTVLDFGSDEFPLYFFNDSQRFNLRGTDRLDRGKVLEWSAHWVGYLNMPADSTITIWLTASGPGELALDGQGLLRVDAPGRATSQREVQLTRGPHELRVSYIRKKERSGFLQVSTDLAGPRRPLAPPLLTAEPYSPERLAIDGPAALVARAVDLAFVALLLATLVVSIRAQMRGSLALGRSPWPPLERPLLALVPLGFFLQAALTRLDRFGKMVFLDGGQDWLTYETFARDIQINGPLMTLGSALGQGAVYYHHQLYPYYLALLHTLAGEDLYGVFALQVMSLGVAAVLVHQIARRLFGQTTALVALALMLVVLVPLELAWVPRTLLSESLYFWLMPAAILALLSLVDHVRSFRRGGLEPQDRIVSRPPYQLALLVGALLGLACLARNPTFAYLLPAGVLVWHALRQRGLARVPTAGSLAMVGVGAALVIGPVPLRNAIVAGKPAILASNGGAALEIYHRPSPAVRLSKIDEDPLYQWLKVDRPTREVIEYVRQDPVGYFSSWLPLAAYALGIGSAMNHLLDVPPIQLRPHLLVLNALYVLAMFMVARARRPESGLLHAFIGIHLLCMVVFMPYSYENRPVLPMYLFVTVFAAAALVEIRRRVPLMRGAHSPPQVRHWISVGRSTLTRTGPN